MLVLCCITREVQFTDEHNTLKSMSNLVSFLASDEARYITGMNIRIDAGAMLKGMPAGMG